MKRTGLAALLVAGLVVTGVLVWDGARQDREFRRLVALGDAALAQGQTFEAAEAFSGAVALRPDSMLAHLKRGDTYRRRGDLAAALRDLRRASQLDPGAVRPHEGLGDVNLAMGRYARAIEDYRDYLAIDERAPRVLYKLGLALYRDRRPREAVTPLRAALALDERLAEAQYTLGLCLGPGRPAEAVRALTRAVELQPSSVPARAALVDSLTSLGRWREAAAHLEAMASLEPDSPTHAVRVAMASTRLDRVDTAIGLLNRAVTRFPGEPGVRAALGRLWLDRAPDAAALDHALSVLRPGATAPVPTGELLGLYGRALARAGRHAEAEQVLEQAAGRLPVETETLTALASTSERLGHLQSARQALLDAVDLGTHDADPGILLRISALSLALRDVPSAITWARRAVDEADARHDGLWDAAQTALARALERAGQTAEAQAARQEVRRGSSSGRTP